MIFPCLCPDMFAFFLSVMIVMQLEPFLPGEMNMMSTVHYAKLIPSHGSLITVELW
jgi:hypothetical protein